MALSTPPRGVAHSDGEQPSRRGVCPLNPLRFENKSVTKHAQRISPATSPSLAPLVASRDPTRSPPSKPIRGFSLRLPSFELLGIAAPHSKREPVAKAGAERTRSVSSTPNTSHTVPGAGKNGNGDKTKFQSPQHTGDVASTSQSTPLKSRQPTLYSPGPEASGKFTRVPFTSNELNTSQPNDTSDLSQSPMQSQSRQTSSWVEQALTTILTNTPFDSLIATGSLHILVQALPRPTEGHAYLEMITQIQHSIDRPIHINLSHAVSGSLTINDIPVTPPTTPSLSAEGNDYFRVFGSAVGVPDYQLSTNSSGEHESLQAQSGAVKVHSPNPSVAPGSIHVSLIERYIPPTSAREFSQMFQLSGGQSILSDRLMELSDQNGILLFVYPTKTGGRTFARKYLSPILDPIVRTLMVEEKITSECGEQIANLSPIESMPTFEDLETKISKFLISLNNAGDSQSKGALTSTLSRFHLRGATDYSLISASKAGVVLDRISIEEWWARQERHPMKCTLERNQKSRFRSDQLPPSLQHFQDNRPEMPMGLVHRILESVIKCARQKDYQHCEQVEIGVFAIRKTLRAVTTSTAVEDLTQRVGSTELQG